MLIKQAIIRMYADLSLIVPIWTNVWNFDKQYKPHIIKYTKNDFHERNPAMAPFTQQYLWHFDSSFPATDWSAPPLNPISINGTFRQLSPLGHTQSFTRIA